MITKRRGVLIGVGIGLFVLLLSANLVVTADRTVLDAEFVTDTAEEENLYGAMTDEFHEMAEEEADGQGGETPAGVSEEELMQEAFTEEYARTQVEENIHRLYAYLHGDRDDLRLELDAEPLKQSMLAEVEGEADDIDLAETDVPEGEAIEEMADDEAAFDRHRGEFREEQKERIQEETDRELSDEELEERLDEEMDRIREHMYDELDSELDGEFEGAEAHLEEPVHELGSARIDALTGAASYEEYATRIEAAKDDLGDAIVAMVEAELDEEMGEPEDFTEGMDDEATEALETTRSAVSVLNVLVFVLPLLTVGVVGALWWVAPTSVAAIETGVVSLLVGTIGIAGSWLAVGQLEALLAGEVPGAMGAFVLGLVSGIGGALTAQSVVLLVVGIGCVGVGVAVRRDMILPDRD